MIVAIQCDQSKLLVNGPLNSTLVPIERWNAAKGGVSMSKDTSPTPHTTEGMGWRVSVSIVTFFGSMIAVILWLFFFAGDFNVYQNMALVVVILLAFVALMGATWAPWGMRQSRDSWSKS